ncbi:MAG: ABC transporter permease [Anaerolineales bacterium]|nr:ABC transporter permease [Anaerolineales bacterium]
MNMQLTLALRYLSGRKLRTLLTTLAIVFGVLVVFGINSILPAFVESFQAGMMAVAGQVDVVITHKTGAPFLESTVAQVQAIRGVRAATGTLNRTINLPADYIDSNPQTPDRITALSLIGVRPEFLQGVRAYPVSEGRFLAQDDLSAAVIRQSFADTAGLGLGDTLSIPSVSGALDLTIVGILPSKVVPGNEEVYITLPQAQQALQMQDQINAIDANFDTMEDEQREEILTTIQQKIGANFELGGLTSGDELLVNIRLGQSVLNILGILALFMGGFIIFNTFRTIITERRRDIGMLRAVGANRKTILGLILSETLLQGVIGTAAGLILGYLLAWSVLMGIEPMLKSFFNLNLGAPVISFGVLVGSILLGIGFTVIAGLIPALQARRITPLEALRPPEPQSHTKRLTGTAFWAGVVMIGAALATLLAKNIALTGLGGVLFFFGLLLASPGLVNPITGAFARLAEIIFARQGTGSLAASNLTRQPARTAVTASATMIGLAVILMATSLTTSLSKGFIGVLKKTLGSDYLIIPPSVMVWGTNMGASPQLAEDLRALDGVDAVSTLRFASSELIQDTGNIPVSLLGIDPLNFELVSGLQFVKGEQEQALAQMAVGRNVIANAALAMTAGLDVGDEIRIVTAEGEQTYHVVGVGMDYLNAKIMGIYISQANIAADFGRAEDVMLQVNLKEGADRQAVEPAIRALLEPYPQFTLISGKAYLEQNMKLFDSIFIGMYVLLIFLSVPSIIAMVNTLAIGVIERTREIGMLRAVGSTRKQIRTLVLAEALILAAIGASFGVAAGLYLGYLAVQALSVAGFPLQYLFPGSWVIIAIVASLIFGALAAVIPARQASHMDVVAALRFE